MYILHLGLAGSFSSLVDSESPIVVPFWVAVGVDSNLDSDEENFRFALPLFWVYTVVTSIVLVNLLSARWMLRP